VGLYHSHFDLFEAALQKKGGSIKELLVFFKTSSEHEKDLLTWTEKWVKAEDPGSLCSFSGDSSLWCFTQEKK
jgi:hypothetical protein